MSSNHVDISTADVDTLADVLVDINRELVIATVDYRAPFGVFVKFYELTKVKGFSVVLIEKKQELIAVDTDPDSAW